MSDEIKDYSYPNIETTDYIDESLSKILDRDDASKCGFRRVSTFPAVTKKDIGMEIYLLGQGTFRLIATEPEVYWFQVSADNVPNASVDFVNKNFQPVNDVLTSLSKLNSEQTAVVYFAGSKNLQATAISAYMLGILNSEGADKVRELLGLGDLALLDAPLDGNYIKEGSIDVSKVSIEFKKNLGWSTGDVKMTFKQAADDGWVFMNDGSIGNTGSGATTRANPDTKDLFSLLWNIPSVTLQSYAGTSASKTTVEADWSSNKRLILPKALGRVMAGAGTGSGLSKRDLGSSTGSEKHQLTNNELPSHRHTSVEQGGTRTATNKNALAAGYLVKGVSGSGIYTGYTGGNAAHNNMQPTTFVNYMIKL